MIHPRHLLAGLAVLAAAWTPLAAGAAMIPRAEKGAVIVLSEAPKGLEAPVVVAKGDVAWTQPVRPALAVRLLDPLAERTRPHGKPIEAGAVLFGYSLSSGTAFCPPVPRDVAVPEVQCLRDLDGNKTFDGCYVGETRSLRSHFLLALVSGLDACGQHRYEPVEWDAKDAVTASLVFKGFKKGVATFLIRLEDESLDGVDYCAPEGDSGVCAIAGLRLKVTPEGDKARIVLISAEQDYAFAVFSAGGPDLPDLRRLRADAGSNP